MSEPQTPRENGKDMAGVNRDAAKQAEATETETDMSANETEIAQYADPHETIENYEGMFARQQTRFEWTVLHLKDGEENTSYLVNTRELSCSCPDHEYNKNGGHSGEVCKHLAMALYAAQEQAGTEELSRWSMQHELSKAQEAGKTIEHIAEWANKLGSTVDPDAANEKIDAVNESENGDDGATPEENEAANGAAEQLQHAFDEVLDDMQVKANEGLVWFQTGQDTPDDWPFPGGDKTFKVVTSPDNVMFVHDGSADWADSPHKHHDKKPGEWFKNALEPSEVENYIAEVLE